MSRYKILTFSTLFPNAVRPNHGIFVETRLRQLLASGQVEATVLAPVPWFPSAHPRFGIYAKWAAVPKQESRFNIEVLHPRYPLLPKVGMTLAPLLLASALKKVIRQHLATGQDFDLIDAHYFYPDGVAAVLLGRWFNKPVVITSRGSDVNLLPQYWAPRKMIQWAAAEAAGLITVSAALKQSLLQLGVEAEKVHVLRNGVDLQLFHGNGREQAREHWGLKRFTLLSVGNLVPLKGHDLVIRALPDLADMDLMIAGEGPERERLQQLARALGVADRVRFLGLLPQSVLQSCYVAADVLLLASEREGWPNVLLEAMACGTPVVATAVGGIPEVLQDARVSRLLSERTSNALVQAIRSLSHDYPTRQQVAQYAAQFSWDETTQGQLALFQKILLDRRNGLAA